MKWKWIAVGLLVVVGLGMIAFASRRPSGHGARIVSPKPGLDLGSGKTGEVLKGKIRFANAGDSELKFQVKPTCGCTEIDPIDGSVLPGATQEVMVAMKVDGEVAEKLANLHIATNDETSPTFSYWVRSSQSNKASISPKSVDFGRLMRGDKPTRIVHVRSLSRSGANSSRSSEVAIIRKDPALMVSRCDGSEADEGAAYKITLDTSKLDTFYKSVIVCQVPGIEDMQEIPVSAIIAADRGITVAPSSITRRSEQATVPSHDPFVLVIKNDGKALGNPTSVEVPDGFSLDFEKTKSLARMRIRITESSVVKETYSTSGEGSWRGG